jgi:hypothetical protein
VAAVKQGIPEGVKYLLVANVSFDPEAPVSNEVIELNRDSLTRLDAREGA